LHFPALLKPVTPSTTSILSKDEAVFFLLTVTANVMVEAQKCKPSGKIRGKNPPKDECNQDNGADCCQAGKFYTTFKCSPPVTKKTKATLTINSFAEGGDGGGPSECDGKYHDDNTPVVALSTGWFNNRKRCHKFVTISANGKSVKAMVVDECDSTMGCDSDHGYQPPCPNNVVDASKAVWKALGVNEHDKEWGWMDHQSEPYLEKMKQVTAKNFTCFLFLVLLTVTTSVMVEAKTCKPSGKIRGRKPPKDQCNQRNGADCCQAGKFYATFKCSPPVTKKTKATLTINSFKKGGDGGAPSECDGKYHDDNTPVVALSTGWFNNRKRCHKFVTISANGKSVKAMVVDECDSTLGCDSDHGYQPPCPNNIVDASKAVWKALGINEHDREWGWMDVTWTDA
ncbi:hypothetical protein Tsubulata_047076, partial [Turnera subulata]